MADNDALRSDLPLFPYLRIKVTAQNVGLTRQLRATLAPQQDHVGDKWSYTVAGRFASRVCSTVDNSDVNAAYYAELKYVF